MSLPATLNFCFVRTCLPKKSSCLRPHRLWHIVSCSSLYLKQKPPSLISLCAHSPNLSLLKPVTTGKPAWERCHRHQFEIMGFCRFYCCYSFFLYFEQYHSHTCVVVRSMGNLNNKNVYLNESYSSYLKSTHRLIYLIMSVNVVSAQHSPGYRLSVNTFLGKQPLLLYSNSFQNCLGIHIHEPTIDAVTINRLK